MLRQLALQWASVSLLALVAMHACANSRWGGGGAKRTTMITRLAMSGRVSSLPARSKWDETKGILPSAYERTGFREPWNAPKWVLRAAFHGHRSMLPLLHRFDRCSASNACKNLQVLWWKAIASNRYGSKLYDGGVAFDMLPSFTRWIVGFPFCWLYPSLHHQNVAIRTAFLDEAMRKELYALPPRTSSDSDDVTVVVLGAGFDTRSLRLSEEMQCPHTRWIEFDLPDVVQQKRLVLERFSSRRPERKGSLPELHGADLNQVGPFTSSLRAVLGGDSTTVSPVSAVKAFDTRKKKRLILVAEASLLYLEKDKILPIIRESVKVGRDLGHRVSFCFADRFPGVHIAGDTGSELENRREREEAETFLSAAGLELVDWFVKRGSSRHMGIARTKD